MGVEQEQRTGALFTLHPLQPTGLRFLGPLSLWNKGKQHLVRVWGCWTLLPSLSSFVYPFLVTV